MKKIILFVSVAMLILSCGESTSEKIEAQINELENTTEEVVTEVIEEVETKVDPSYVNFTFEGEEVKVEEFASRYCTVQLLDELGAISLRSADEKYQFSIGVTGPGVATITDQAFEGYPLSETGRNEGTLNLGFNGEMYTLVEGEVNITRIDTEANIMEGSVNGKVATPVNLNNTEAYLPLELEFHTEGIRIKDNRTK